MTHHLLGLHRKRAVYERKEEDPSASNPDIKKLWDSFLKNFNDFKSANDERFKNQGTELKKSIDVLIDEKVNRINAALDTQQKLIDGAVAEMKRAPLSQKNEQGYTPDQQAYNGAFANYMRKGDRAVPTNMVDMAMKSYGENQFKALSEGSNPDGGYLVSPEVDSAIYRVAERTIAMRKLATVRTVSSPSYEKMINVGGASSGWVGETSSRSSTTTPSLEKLVFSTGEIYAEPHATQTLLDDASINIEQWLADEVGIEFAEKENAAFISGTGAVGKPKGLLSYTMVADASWAWGSVGYVVTGAAADFDTTAAADEIKDLITALKTKFCIGASFIMHRRTTGKIRKFKDSQNQYIWQPGLQAGEPSSIDGYPFHEDDDWDEAGANKYLMGFGNWQQSYVIVDRIGVRVLRDPFTSKPYVKFYTTKRVGGGVQNFESYKLLKCST